MHKSAAYIRDASRTLFKSRLVDISVPSRAWDFHFRALLRAFDMPFTHFGPRQQQHKALHCQSQRNVRRHATTKQTRSVKEVRPSSTVAAATESFRPCSTSPRRKRFGARPARFSVGPLSIFNLSDHVALTDLERAIRLRQAENAWSIFATLASSEEERYIPLMLCSSLFSLLTFAKTLAGRSKVAAYRQEQIDHIIEYVESEFEIPRDQFMASAEVIPIEPYKFLQRSVKANNRRMAWTIFCRMPLQDKALVPRNTYLKLMSMIHGDRKLDDWERKRRLDFIANRYDGVPDNGRKLSAKELLTLARIYHRLSIGDKGTACAMMMDAAPELSADAVTELVWRAVEFGQLQAAQDLVDTVEKLHGGLMEGTSNAYITLIDAYRERKQYTEALEVFETLLNAGVPPQVRAFNAVLQVFAEQGAYEQATYIFNSMLQLNIQPDQATMSEMIKAHALGGDLRSAVSYYHSMDQYHLEPNAYTYSILIEGYSRRHDVNNVIWWFHEMLKRDVAPNEATISCVLKAFGRRTKTHPDIGEAAMQIASQSMAAGIKADAILYAILLRIQGALTGVNGVLKIHSEMLQRHIEPTVYTYTILIYTCGKNNAPDTAQQIFDLMKESRHQPNTITYCALMDAWSRARRGDKIERLVEEFMEESRKDDGSRLWIDTKVREFMNAVRTVT